MIVTAVGADVSGVEAGEKVLYPRDAGFEVRLARYLLAMARQAIPFS